jgi:uncharacterized protein (DUF362 family)
MMGRGFLDPRVLWREARRWASPVPPGPHDGPPPRAIPGASSRLVVANDAVALQGGRPSAEPIRRMLAEGLRALTGAVEEGAAWRALLPGLRPDQIVGLKINTVAVHLVPHRAVVDAIVASLGEAGIGPEQVVIWDNLGRVADLLRRTLYGNVERRSGSYYQGMERAGYAPATGAVPRVLCTVPVPPGVGYDDDVHAEIPSQGLTLPVTRILTRVCDHVINVPVPKDHRVTGITCALKNFYGSVPLWDDLRPRHADRMHANRGDPQVAELYSNPAVSGKVRLHVCDALRAICDGGPWGKLQLEPRSLLLGTDPVAMDAYVLAMIDAGRRQHGLAPIAARARYLESAARAGLGTNDPESIEIIGRRGEAWPWPT